MTQRWRLSAMDVPMMGQPRWLSQANLARWPAHMRSDRAGDAERQARDAVLHPLTALHRAHAARRWLTHPAGKQFQPQPPGVNSSKEHHAAVHHHGRTATRPYLGWAGWAWWRWMA